MLFTMWSGGGGQVAVLPAGETEPRTLLPGTSPVYLSSGDLVFQREGALFAVPFDLTGLRPTGEAVPVIEDVQLTGNGAAQYDLSGNGTLVFVPESQPGARRLVWMERDRWMATALDDLGTLRDPVLSPDGERVAVSMAPGLSVFDLARGLRTSLVDGFVGEGVAWSSDGQRVAYKPNIGRYGVRAIEIIGNDDIEILFDLGPGYVNEEGVGNVRSWSPDGRHLAYTGSDDLWLLEIDAEATRLTETPERELYPSFSPDGRFLAYGSNETGSYEVHVLEVSSPGTRWIVSNDLGGWATWSRDSEHLRYFSEAKHSVIEVDVATEPTLVLGDRRVLPLGDLTSLRPVGDGLAPADGDPFLFVDESSIRGNRGIEVILNWTEELKRLVPVED